MTDTLTIVALITAKVDRTDFVKSELMKLIEVTRSEAGCINYDLHQDNEHPNIFMFYENWENRPLWQDHMNSEHLKAYLEATDGSIASFVVHEMTNIEN